MFKVEPIEYTFDKTGEIRHYADLSLFIDNDELLIGYPIDLSELVESLKASSDCFIITCDCGIPQCAGIFQGIKVKHNADEIEWRITQPIKAHYTFSRKEYTEALEMLLTTLVDKNLDSDLGCNSNKLDFHKSILGEFLTYQKN